MTIVEMLVAMSIFLIVVAAVYLVYQTSQATFWRGSAQADIQQSVRSTMEEMRRQIRNAGYDPSKTTLAGVQTLGTNSVAFISSVEFFPNPPSTPTSALVTYSACCWDAQKRLWSIQRSVQARSGGSWAAATVTTVARVSTVDSTNPLTFTYLDANGAVTASGTAVRRIRIRIHGSEKDQVHEVTTDVFLRNL